MNREDEILASVKEHYGSTLDLDRHPEHLIDIIRRFGFEQTDGGTLPGGVPPTPPPGPTSMAGLPSNGDLMKEILKLSRQVAVLQERVGEVAPGEGVGP